MQAEARKSRKGCGFIKHIEVPDSELLSYRLRNFKSCTLICISTFVIAKLDAARSRLWLDWECNKLRVRLNGQCLVEGVEFFANFGKLARIDWNKRAVLGLGDSQMLNIKWDQV